MSGFKDLKVWQQSDFFILPKDLWLKFELRFK